MAKKVTIDTLKKRLNDLKEVEQTEEVIAEMAELTQQIEAMEPKTNSPFRNYEEWRFEKKIVDGKVTFERLKKVKETRLLPEQAAELNSQVANSLIEYIEKK
jgi:predicted secreted Zn-dependent protease